MLFGPYVIFVTYYTKNVISNHNTVRIFQVTVLVTDTAKISMTKVT